MLQIDLPDGIEKKISFLVEFSCLFKKLRSKEKDVLKRILYYQFLKNYDILMDYDIKVNIREDLSISEYNLNNILSSLRKRNVLTGNKLNETYLKLLKENTIIINLNGQKT